ncbi:MAG TPA: PspC domain-containing protein [Candidatus Paceibacterota bacterium]|nr:PspC domain-containing protein [Candidatus Paceibacterota bacterium]
MKKIYRAPREGILGGVAAGFAQYFDTDPVFVRLGVAVLAIVTEVWPVLLLYVFLYIIMPVDPAQETVQSNQEPKDVTPAGDRKEEPVERMDSGQNM